MNEAEAPTPNHTEVFCPDDWDSREAAHTAMKSRVKAYLDLGGWETASDEYEDSHQKLMGYVFQAWPIGTERPAFVPIAEAVRIGPSGVVEVETPHSQIQNQIIDGEGNPVLVAQRNPTPDELLHEEAVNLILESNHNPEVIRRVITDTRFGPVAPWLTDQFSSYLSKRDADNINVPIALRPAEPHSPKPNTEILDNSILTSVAQCSTQAYMQYIMHYRSSDQSLYFEAGTAAHLMIENYFRGVPAEDCLRIFDDYYKEWAAAVIDTLPDKANGNEHSAKRLTHSNVRKILERWLEANPLSELPFIVNPDLVEIGFQYPLNDEGDLVFVGRIDAIVRNREDTAWRVLDHKTTGSIDFKFMDRINLGSQMTGYIEGAQVCFSEPVEGAMINAIEFKKLPSSNRTCKEHGTDYAECGPLHAKFQYIGPIIRSEHEAAAWKQCAASLARKFRDMREKYTKVEHVHSLQMQGRFTGACSLCTFKDWCDVGRPVEPNILNGMLRREVWEPWEGAFGERTKPEIPEEDVENA